MSSDLELLASQQSPAEIAPTSLPSNIERALAMNFGMAITGYLCCVEYQQSIQCLVGIVYRESRGRFRDGATILTSKVCRRVEHREFNLFQTVNGSTYVVCDWALDGGSPRFEGSTH